MQQRILRAKAATPADTAVQVRRLVVLADVEPRPHALLAPPRARSLVASVLAVVEREVDGADQGETRGLNGQRFNSAGQPG